MYSFTIENVSMVFIIHFINNNMSNIKLYKYKVLVVH